jgi:capsular polysaccharide biosynthesis protein
LFRDADVIAGPRGAGLTNMLFATDAAVLEITSARPGPGVRYLSLAWSMGHEYRYHLAKPVGTDFEVDVRGLARTLDEMLSANR